MPNRRKSKAKPNLEHGPEWQHPTTGQVLSVGDHFSVKGLGRMRFRYVWPPDGSIACFGPVDSKGAPKNGAMNRAIRPEKITRIFANK